MELADIPVLVVIISLSGVLGIIAWRDHKRVSSIRKYYRDHVTPKD